MRAVKEKVAEVKHDAARLQGYLIAQPVEEKIASAFNQVERQVAESLTYQTGLQLMDTLSQIQRELRELRDSYDRTIKMWRVVTGREAQTFEGHTMQVTAAIFAPDGQAIVSGSWDKTIRLWNITTGLTMRILTGHSKGVASLAVSADGRWLASGGEDATVMLWDLEMGAVRKSFSGHRNSVTSVAFSPDGELLAAGCLGQVVIVWKLSTGEIVKRLRYENIRCNPVAFSPQGQWLALGSRDLQIWLKAILTEEEYATVKVSENMFHFPYHICHLALQEPAFSNDK
jgi:WD40 repeat protein